MLNLNYKPGIIAIGILQVLWASSVLSEVYNPFGSVHNKCSDCGRVDTHRKNPYKLMVNATPVHPTNKYPWMVSLMKAGTREKFCGGAIISDSFILTAAHCLHKSLNPISRSEQNFCSLPGGMIESCFFDPSEVIIGFLTSTFEVIERSPVQQLIHHPQFYYTPPVLNDIALVKLAYPITCNRYAIPICLPPKGVTLNEGDRVTVTGWGAYHPPSQEGTIELHEATLIVVSPYYCLRNKIPSVVTPSYCLSGHGEQSPCKGDSGGSMFVTVNGRYYSYGVASRHTDPLLCDSHVPIIYTAVEHFLPWIYETIGMAPYTAQAYR